MKGDYSRDTFDPTRHFSRVLMQQGRVQVDADWNEQASILLHYLRSLAVDLIGSDGGPAGNLGFGIELPEDKIENLTIAEGHYYVDGILCENEGPQNYYRQPNYPLDPKKKDGDKLPDQLPFLVYLDVWERHITAIEEPAIQEVALEGPDTTARAMVVWQARVVTKSDIPGLGASDFDPVNFTCSGFEETNLWTLLKGWLQPEQRGRMAAKAQEPDEEPKDVCIVSPEARYRGAENQLYRVEIHKRGKAGEATFKWSRENGAVVFPIELVADKSVTLENLGRDDRFGLEVGDWVEVIDNIYVGRGRTKDLLRVTVIDAIDRLITLSDAPTYGHDPNARPLLRRWDQQRGYPDSADLEKSGGAVVITEDEWISLEDGIQVKFDAGQTYRSGDYWLIPARTVTGNVEWPKANEEPLALPPHGVDHHYAPLAIVSLDGGKTKIADLRHSFSPYGSCCPTIAVISDKATVFSGNTIKFTARISRPDSNLKYHWSVTGGNLTTVAGESIVATATTQGTLVATVVVEGLPPGCSNTAMSACDVQ